MTEETTKDFSKSDYLTPPQVAKLLNIEEDTVYKTLKNLYLRRATVLINKKYIRPMVICARYSHTVKDKILPYRLRSDSITEFIEYLKTKQTKGK